MNKSCKIKVFRFCFLFLMIGLQLIGLTQLSAQEPTDSTLVKKLLEYETKIDSLRTVIRSLTGDIQYLKQTLAESDVEFQNLLSLLAGEDETGAPEDQRSRRKRVDALLRVIGKRPGQLQFNGDATAIIQGNPGSKSRFSVASGSMDLFVHTNFGSNILLFFDFEAIGGNGPIGFIPSLSNLNADAGSTQSPDGIDRLNVLEAWLEFTLLNEQITATIGKIDLTNYFDNNNYANDETSQFYSGPFVNNASFAVPSNSPGIRLRTTLLNRFYLQMAIAKETNSGQDVFHQLYRIIGIGYRLLPDTPGELNFRIFGYRFSRKPRREGFGISVDKQIYEQWGIWGRFGQNNFQTGDSIRHPVSRAWSTGIRFASMFRNKKIIMASAFGEMHPLDKSQRSEKLLEIYIRREFNRWIYYSLHFQQLWDSAGNGQSYSVLGLRTQFNF